MKRRKRKSGCASGVFVVFLIAVAAIYFMFTEHSFTGNVQIEPLSNVSVFNSTLIQNPVQTGTSSDSAEAINILILVNKSNKLPAGFKVTLTTIENVQVAQVLLDDLIEMRKAAEKDNVYLYIRSAYRTRKDQKKAFSNTVSGYVNQGNSRRVARNRTEQVVARPGYSEHHTGLAIDFSLDSNAEKQAEMWEWLSKNAYKYGFILRYPEGKEQITGYTFEPWHYRYVGREHAQSIFYKDLLLEEYLKSLE